MSIDKHGTTVVVGSKVKIISIDQKSIASIPDDGKNAINSMLNHIFEVYEIDEYDQAWVMKEWVAEDGTIESHSVALSASEMEVV